MIFARDIPDEVRKEFANLIFTSTFSILTIGTALSAVAGFVFAAEPGPVTGLLLAGSVLVTAARVALGLAYRQHGPDAGRLLVWLGWYGLGGCLFSALIACLSAFASLRGHPGYEVLATTVLFAYATGMIVRVAACPRLALAQLLVAFIPAAVANLVAADGIHVLLASLEIAFALSGSEMIKHLFDTSLARALSQRELARRSLHDELTGLPNRAHFRQRLEAAWGKWGSSAREFSVFMLDLDGFKPVNDDLGHLAGDDVLVAVSARLRDALGPSDFLARLGGDEFAVLHEGTESIEARRARAAGLLQKVAAEPFRVGKKRLRIGLSIGGATAARGASSAEGILRSADTALYTAKAAGKGCFAESASGGAGGPINKGLVA